MVSLKKIIFFLFLTVPFYVLSQNKLSKKDSVLASTMLSYAEHYEKNGNKSGAGDFYEKIAFMYWKNNRANDAENYYLKAFKNFTDISDDEKLAPVAANLGLIYSEKKSFDQAHTYIDKALAIFTKKNNEQQLIVNYKNKAVVYAGQKDYANAVELSLKALNISEKKKDNANLSECYALLSEYYDKKGDKTNSLKYFELFKGIKGLNKTTTHVASNNTYEKENRTSGIKTFSTKPINQKNTDNQSHEQLNVTNFKNKNNNTEIHGADTLQTVKTDSVLNQENNQNKKDTSQIAEKEIGKPKKQKKALQIAAIFGILIFFSVFFVVFYKRKKAISNLKKKNERKVENIKASTTEKKLEKRTQTPQSANKNKIEPQNKKVEKKR